MKKKTIALCGLVAVAGLSLASCGKKTDDGSKIDEPTYDTDGGELDIHINYQAESGVTYRESSPYTNVIEDRKSVV